MSIEHARITRNLLKKQVENLATLTSMQHCNNGEIVANALGIEKNKTTLKYTISFRCLIKMGNQIECGQQDFKLEFATIRTWCFYCSYFHYYLLGTVNPILFGYGLFSNHPLYTL